MEADKILVRNINRNFLEMLKARKPDIQLSKSGVFLCSKGELTVNIDGKNYKMASSSILVYFSFSSLRVIDFSDDAMGVVIGAELEMLQPLFYSVTNFNALFVIKQHPYKELTRLQFQRFLQFMELFVETAKRAESEKSTDTSIESPVRELSVKQKELLTSVIVLEVIQCYADLNIDTSHQTRKDELLQSFVTQLYRKYRTEHEVSYYAEQQYLTSRYFSAIIKERSGKSPSQWIATALLVDAKSLLTKTNKSIKDISEILGFPTQSYFGKWFKNLTGVGPLEYRNGKETKEGEDKNFSDVVARGIRHINSEEQ